MEDITDYSKVAVVIPCFRVKAFILDVIAGIPPCVEKIFVIDDACPEQSGVFVQMQCSDTRVEVVFNSPNSGVGGATIEGYRRAIAESFSIVVKIDGDGQMDGAQIRNLISLIESKQADYTKGNRFYYPDSLQHMPQVRFLGNAILSFVTKFSSGYWDIFDPTNGFTAISMAALKRLPLDKISQRYFFESDMLFRLNTIRAVVVDIPMDAKYGCEQSNLSIGKNIWPFLKGNLYNFFKRIVYNYYLRNFSLASLELVLGLLLILFGVSYGIVFWLAGAIHQHVATAGTVMVAALPIIVGFQLIMSFLNYDISTVPRRSLTSIL